MAREVFCIPVDSAESEKPSNAGLSWQPYLKSLAEFVLLKGLVDLGISVVLVAVFYSVASLLGRLLPERLLPVFLDARAAAILLAIGYLLSMTLAASIRFFRLARSDIKHLYSKTHHGSGDDKKGTTDVPR